MSQFSIYFSIVVFFNTLEAAIKNKTTNGKFHFVSFSQILQFRTKDKLY